MGWTYRQNGRQQVDHKYDKLYIPCTQSNAWPTEEEIEWFQRLPPARGGTAQKKIIHLANWSQLIHPGRWLITHPSCCYLDIRDFEWFDNGPDHGKQQQQQPKRRWRDDLDGFQTQWERTARDRRSWRHLRKAYVQQRNQDIRQSQIILIDCASPLTSYNSENSLNK